MISIEPLEPRDWDRVHAIYAEGIASGNATFETAAPDWARWDAVHLLACRLVARDEGDVVGWAALGRVSTRPVYVGVAEVSVYVAAAHRGRGIGARLLERLVAESEAHGIWTLQAGIFPENRASIALHQRLGFRVVGRRERIGKHHGVWRDVLLLERRSDIAGFDP